MNKYSKKKDDNHNDISQLLQKSGFTVIDCSRYDGLGFDLMVKRDNGLIYCIEIKDGNKPPSARKLTQAELHAKEVLKEHFVVLESIENALSFIHNYQW